MKRFLLGLSVAALVSAGSLAAFAQSADDFESEFKAFKKKAEAAKESPAPAADADKADAAPSPVSLPSPVAKKDDGKNKNMAASPLGPAGDLPVNGQLPATSYAMGVQSPEEMQAKMDADLKEQKKKNDQATFDEALKILLPMSPEQIRKTLDTFKDSRRAAKSPIAMPTPKVEVETVSLDPSQTPSVIKTSQGRVTTLTILDSTGSPWPIQDVSWAGKFDVTPPEEGGHVVRITPMTAHGAGNMSIRLIDLITPITFTLQAGIDEVYYRFDARIPKQGPLAKTPIIEYGGLSAETGGDENLVQVLDGTPPAAAEKLKVDGADGRTNVWRVSGHIYLRTPLTLLSPTWNSSVTSADGMNVYTLSDTPVVLLSDQGRMVRVHIAAEGQP